MSSASITLSDILAQTSRAKAITTAKVKDIRTVTSKLRILALNALIEAKHAGEKGAGFSVVADEVRAISSEVEGLARDLSHEIVNLDTLTQDMASATQGARLTDLALNAIELIDRNLYERTCDVRWWATDSALWQALTASAPNDLNKALNYATRRLGVILDSYTVYLDLWLCTPDGRILANGRPDRYHVQGQNVQSRDWFNRALGLRSGQDFAVADIMTEPLLGNAQVATYATGVRRDGDPSGELLGILGIQFDWHPQAKSITEGVRLSEEERSRTRVLLIDASGLVIAASDGKGILTERLRVDTGGRPAGHYVDSLTGNLVAFHRTPGYETYAGLGWYGVILQSQA